jgi:hypothetical protein
MDRETQSDLTLLWAKAYLDICYTMFTTFAVTARMLGAETQERMMVDEVESHLRSVAH